MKKLLLFSAMAITMMACSSDKDDEPNGGGNNNGSTEQSGWTVTFLEQTTLNDEGTPILTNTTTDCSKWKAEYGKYFEDTTYGNLKSSMWTSEIFSDYNFKEIDNLLTEYVGFTVMNGYGIYDPAGCDLYSGIAINLSKDLYGLMLEYIYGGSQIYEENNEEWEAFFMLMYVDPYHTLNGNLPENVNNWIDKHKENLISKDTLDGDTGFKMSWIFNPKNLNETYVKDEIYPFISMTDYKYLTLTVSINQKDSKITRDFVYGISE